MFYKKIPETINGIDTRTVKDFDSWLAALPRHKKTNITAAKAAAQLQTSYAQANKMLELVSSLGILKKKFHIICPECGFVLSEADPEDTELFPQRIYCDVCEKERNVSLEDIVTAYDLVEDPDAAPDDIEKEIEENRDERLSANVVYKR